MVRAAAALGSVLALLLSARADPPPRATPAQPLLAFLNQAIGWYRQQAAQAQLATEPSDVVFAGAARQQARRVVQLAFDFARADAALEPAPAAPADAAGARARSGAPSLASLAADADAAASAAHAGASVAALQRRT